MFCSFSITFVGAKILFIALRGIDWQVFTWLCRLDARLNRTWQPPHWKGRESLCTFSCFSRYSTLRKILLQVLHIYLSSLCSGWYSMKCGPSSFLAYRLFKHRVQRPLNSLSHALPRRLVFPSSACCDTMCSVRSFTTGKVALQ